MKKNLKRFYKDWTQEDIHLFFRNTPQALSLIIPNGNGTNTVIERNAPIKPFNP